MWLNIECIYITSFSFVVYLSLSTPDNHVHLVSPQLYILLRKGLVKSISSFQNMWKEDFRLQFKHSDILMRVHFLYIYDLFIKSNMSCDSPRNHSCLSGVGRYSGNKHVGKQACPSPSNLNCCVFFSDNTNLEQHVIIVDILSSSKNNVLILCAWRYLLVLTNDVTNWKLLRNCVWIELI